jgi:peptide/nickel transport system ATP-binding protein/oligopeptide transport system ATP-binding protein
MALLEVRDLSVTYGRASAVEDVSFDVEEGETLALVGESGSGKSTIALSIPRLLPPSAVLSAAAIRFRGRDLARATLREMRAVRGAEIATVFQDPSTSLCPWLTVGEQLEEVLLHHRRATRREARRRSVVALGEVGIAEPEARLEAWPHELSGGMRQRATIAMALLLEPALLVCDEPTSALDATNQLQVLELLLRLQRSHGTAILLVTHALGVVAAAADRAVVMRAGRIVEASDVRGLFRSPKEDYTRELLASTPGNGLARTPRNGSASTPGRGFP